ncbi:unnamed protein product [Fusarium graminearum]|uniref:Uncharacterized protein n=1 Tax=Gibberella zeae TaxID=5518 RepID=A0A4E9DJ15_GIBZA|nr:unnamed protein product [Fusarium graminearum]CAG1973335.1 unnamed protein product [Fusarium graminearum]
MAKNKKTYNTGDSLVVTDPTTNPALRSLSMGERTGSRVLCELWSYVLDITVDLTYSSTMSLMSWDIMMELDTLWRR